MARKVTLIADEGIFRGLAKQNMLFHQCIGELVDNAIAARHVSKKFSIRIALVSSPDTEGFVDVYVADNGLGMSEDLLADALQLGKSATTDNRLNEHGFGMKNALANLSGGYEPWKIWTRPSGSDQVFTVEGPFRSEMYIRDGEPFPVEEFLPGDISTLVFARVRLPYVQSVQGRGAPAKDLNKLRSWLIEHLGVAYRGYLEQDPDNDYEFDGYLRVSVGNDVVQVNPIPVPMGNLKTEYFNIELAGQVYNLEYKFGTLDTTRRDKLVKGERALYYYQGNIPTQGIDIRLGKRTIATMQFDNIWKSDDGEHRLSRHNRFNDFVGEVLIPELPRGVLSTVNNKTDFNLDDPDWQKIFDRLNQFRPYENIRQRSEAHLQKRWVEMIRATNPDDDVSTQTHVWPPGAQIDVFRESATGDITIYELKTGTASPLDLYQLKMYWDGLVLQGKQPQQAVLLCENFPENVQQMANQMNEHLSPPDGSDSYNIKIETHEEKGIWDYRSELRDV